MGLVPETKTDSLGLQMHLNSFIEKHDLTFYKLIFYKVVLSIQNLDEWKSEEEVNSETARYQLGSQTKLLLVSVAEWIKWSVLQDKCPRFDSWTSTLF